MFSEVGIALAFTAGLVSFLAPCVLPIIPGFLAYLAGTSVAESGSKRREVFLNSLCFVLGFSLVFAAVGVLLNTVLSERGFEARQWLNRIGGGLIIFFGLYLTELIRIPYLEREHKIRVHQRFQSRYLSSVVFGAAFAAGWTPCVGAALGAILGLAAAQPGTAFYLLLAYALGLGLPFLLVGLFAAPASALINRYAHAIHYVNIAFGLLLVAFGILIFVDRLSRIANFEFLNRLLLQ